MTLQEYRKKGIKLLLMPVHIKHNAGTDFSYFEDYKNGTVSIYCNETGETVEVYSCEDGSLLESKINEAGL